MKKINVDKLKKTLRKYCKKEIIIPVVVLVVALSAFGIYKFNSSKKAPSVSDTDFGISTKIKEDKTYRDLEITDIEIEKGENIVHLMANIHNKGEAFNNEMVNIVFLDNEGVTMGTVPTYISSVEANGSVRIDTVIKEEYMKAYDFKVEAK